MASGPQDSVGSPAKKEELKGKYWTPIAIEFLTELTGGAIVAIAAYDGRYGFEFPVGCG
jgi:hypothetical protein